MDERKRETPENDAPDSVEAAAERLEVEELSDERLEEAAGGWRDAGCMRESNQSQCQAASTEG